MTQKRLVFVTNSTKGESQQQHLAYSIETVLDQEQYSYEIVTTHYPKHGTLLAKQASENGAYAVVAVGGDGTINDVVNGILYTKTALAIIPKGSGNGLARSLNIPLKIKDALNVINHGKILNIDVAFANDRPFVSNAGVAFDALITKKFAKSLHHSLPYYTWLVLKYLWLYKEWKFDVTVDGFHTKETAFMLNVANAQQFGYNFQIAPMANYTDGLLDVIIICKFPKLMGSEIAFRAMTGTIAQSPYVTVMRGKEIIISHAGLRLMQTDGDAYECASTIKFTVKQGLLPVIVP